MGFRPAEAAEPSDSRVLTKTSLLRNVCRSGCTAQQAAMLHNRLNGSLMLCVGLSVAARLKALLQFLQTSEWLRNTRGLFKSCERRLSNSRLTKLLLRPMLRQANAVAIRNGADHHAHVLLKTCLMQQQAQFQAARYNRVHVCDPRIRQRGCVQVCHFKSKAQSRVQLTRTFLPPGCSLHQQTITAVEEPFQEVQLLQGWDAVRGLGEVMPGC